MSSYAGKIVLSTKLDTSGLKNAGKSIKSALASTTKAVAAFGAVTAAAIGTVIKKSGEAYADYEQLTGGVETLFKTSADKVKKYADEAYKTAGISSNAYMETVTSFSASLISSLSGDTNKAADVANMALIDMSDNANKMGSSFESIQTAYQGFAKQNYTMLDNLKLGYGGTKTEMERLLKDAEAISGVKYDISNLADVYEAIHQIQTKLDITGTTAKEAEKTISGSGNMAKAAWQNVLTAIAGGGDLDAAIDNFVGSLSKYFDNIEPAVERSLMGVGQLIERIGPKLVVTVSTALIKAIPSLLNAVYKMILGLAQGIAQGIKALFFGGPQEVLEQQAESIAQAVENQETLTEEVKETEKALKKSLAGFDEINTLSSGDGSGSDSTVSYDLNVPGLSESSGELNTAIVTEIESNLTQLMIAVGTAAVAIGVILLFAGQIKWGIGFIIFGAANLGVGMASLSKETVSQYAMNTLNLIMGFIAGALVAIGIILIMVGSTALGIGFIIAGAVFLGVTIFSIAKFSTDPIETTLMTIEAIAGGAMLALGIMLLYFGVNMPLAIGLIAAGAVLLLTAVAQLVAGAVSEEVEAWIYGITAIVNTALLVIGVIMLCCGVITPLSIGLVVAGAVGLATTVAINWNAIVDAIRGPIGKIIAIVSAALLVLGVILLLTGVGIPLGIGLIVAGAAGLVAVVALNWNAIVTTIKDTFNSVNEWIQSHGFIMLILGIILLFTGVAIPVGLALIGLGVKGMVSGKDPLWNGIVDKIKEVWQKIKAFWNQHIAPIFTGEFWKDLAKKCGNGLIAGFEGAINGIISMFESMINWVVNGLNKISFDVPDWVPLIGGKKFGFSIPEVKFNRVSIPRLAQGAVIPPNREFMAVLGDQKHGTNIEAPLETIKQALAEVLTMQNGETNVNVTFTGDLAQLARVLKPAIETETRRKGGSLAKGAAF